MTADGLQPDRVVLEGVPRVHFYEGGPRCPEDIIFPSVMRALMEYLREDEFGCRTCRAVQPGCKTSCSYAFFVGVTGAAPFISWKKGWHEDNLAISFMSDDPAAPEQRAFDAAGYGFEWVEKNNGQDNEALFRRRIIESIQKGRPVIGYGIIGPPEPAVIAGYDEGGDVLVGWSFFQQFPDFNAGVEFESSGYFRKRDWFEDTHSLLLIGEKYDTPPLDEICRKALKWMLRVARTPIVKPGLDAPEGYRDRANGLAAYDAWVEHLLRDEDFPAGDETILRQRHDIHNAAVGTVAEARWYGSQFLTGMADHVDTYIHHNMIENLLHAAALYAGEHELMWKLWDLAGGIGNPEAYIKLADPSVRREMVPIIRQARDKDAQAADHIERALAKQTN